MTGTPTESVVAAEITRSGAALALRTPSGQVHIVRCVDIPELSGRSSATGADGEVHRRAFGDEYSRRLASVTLAGDRLLARRADGLEADLSVAALCAQVAHTGFHPGSSATLVIDNCGVLLTADSSIGPIGGPNVRLDGTYAALGCLHNAAVAVCGERIAWLGPADQLAACGLDLADAARIDAGGRLVTPGLIDCHSHPLFGGRRAREFAMRAAGRSYHEIADAGGGIQATTGPTRALSLADHIALTCARMTRALASGTTTSEAKSGYDLTLEGELRLLRVARAVDGLHPVDVRPTLLGAHVVPPEYQGDRRAYVRLVAEQMIPRAHAEGLAESVDVYCDDGAFTRAETEVMLRAARNLGLPVRAHVGQFADLGGAELLAELGALSADHLENVSEPGIAALARAGVVAVMLPGACVQLRMRPPPVAQLRAAGVSMAVASDLNPGTSMCETLPIQMWLATTHYGMTVAETWLGVTRVAARALGATDIGRLRPGARADLVFWDAEHPADVPYRYGMNAVARVIKNGRPVVLTW